jgi:hypothetical protein
MATISEIMKRLENVDVLQLAAESIEDTRSELIENQQEQLFAGKTSAGGDISPFYKPATIAKKKKKGQPTDRVTLKDTGAFYNAVFVDVRQTTFVVDSADPKTEFLARRYKNIFGLDGQFKAQYINDLRPVFNKKIEDITQLKCG